MIKQQRKGELRIMYTLEDIQAVDMEVANAITDEFERQNSHIELIASENWVSKAVMSAMGSVLTNKYAEGYPGKRYYGGCECVDVVEELARERAKELFGCEYANVQPHSGAQANMAVQFAILKPGDTVMGMNLDHGGHLTHGSPVNFSGTYFHIVPYGVNDEGFIDYDKVEEIAMECKPKMIIAGASAYARTIDFKRFREIADACGAVLMVDMAHIAGLVAAGLHPSPIPYAHVVTTTTHKTLRGPRGGMILSSQEIADKYNFNKAIFPGIQGGPLMHVIAAKAVCFKEALQPEFKVYQQNIIDNAQALCKGLLSRDIKIVSGGTDNHLMLVDLTNYDQTGKTVEKLLDSVNITCNKNTIPNDPKSPFVTSGVRLGTPAVTSRGLNTEDMDQIAEAIAMMIKAVDYIALAPKVDANQAYQWLSQSVNAVKGESAAATLFYFLQMSLDKLKADPNHKEQFIQDYLLASEYADAAIAAETNEAKKKNFMGIKDNLVALFVNSGTADCESLQSIYGPKVEANQTDLAYLKKVIDIMKMMRCTESEAYLQASFYAYKIEPTAEAATGCAYQAFKKGDIDGAVKFFDEAIQLETDNVKKAEKAYAAAAVLASAKKLSQARSYCQKAISFNENYGAPYILIANLYAMSPNWSDESALNKCTYFAVIDKLQRAKAVDPSVAEEANKLIGTYSGHTPQAKDLFMLGYKQGDRITIGGWIGETTTIR